MASRTGSFLRTSDRQKILVDLQKKGELTPSKNVPESIRKEAAKVIHSCGNHHDNPNANIILAGSDFGTGCLACGEDDDHANVLLCEACNAEYHTYCLDPPLRAVPTFDWFCSECKAATAMRHFDEDGLDALVNALSPCFTSRFGEVCWAQGGVGFGWWPAFIYDPRLTTGTARQLARKNLGKRHLVYFFECHDAPFSVLTTAKITKWENGLIDDFHLGKTARSAGQKRTKSFKQALQAATVESAKPIEMRMDWNHSDLPQILPSPQQKQVPPPRKRRRREISPIKQRPDLEHASRSKPRSRPRGFPLMTTTQISEMVQVPTRRNLNFALEGLAMASDSANANPIVELAEDGELFVKLLQKRSLPMERPAGEAIPSSESNNSNSNNGNSPCKNVGFVQLLSRKSNTFADARLVIQQELGPDTLSSDMEWRFFVPGLGPVSNKQEASLGPIYSFLRQTTLDTNLGDGTLLHPLKVFIIDLKAATTTCSSTTTTL